LLFFRFLPFFPYSFPIPVVLKVQLRRPKNSHGWWVEKLPGGEGRFPHLTVLACL
jgi:hypothetical protein